MTTKPLFDDPMTALGRNDGTTAAHHDDHGNIIGHAISAKKYLKGDGTTEDAAQITLLQTAAAGKQVDWPPGTYVFPDATTLTLANGMHHKGVHRQTIITVKNAYAFTGTTNLTDILIDGFIVNVRAGATTGGAVKTTTGGGVVASARLQDIYADGGAAVGTLTGALFHLEGWINDQIENCQGSSGQIGFYLVAAPFFNANTMQDCRAVSQSIAGVKLAGPQGLLIQSCVMESNTGYGLWLSTAELFCTIQRNWFESNTSHDIFIDGTTASAQSISVIGNNFSGTGNGTQNHIKITGSATNQRASHVIQGNQMRDLAGSGVNIALDANTTHCVVMGNRGVSLANGTITFANANNIIEYNDNTTDLMDRNQRPGNTVNRFGFNSSTTNWSEVQGDGATDFVLRHFVGASSTTNPRMILHPNLTIGGVGGYSGVLLGKRGDTTDPIAHGGAVYAGTDALGFAAGNGTSLDAAAYVTSDTFATVATKLGFRNSTPITKPTVTGSRGGNAALASLLTALANQGLITDSSS